MEPNDKKKQDLFTFVKRKITEREAELRNRKYMQYMIQAKVSDFNLIQALNFLYKVGKNCDRFDNIKLPLFLFSLKMFEFF